MTKLLTPLINNLLLFAFIAIPHYLFKQFYHVFSDNIPAEQLKSVFPTFCQALAFITVLALYIPIYLYDPKFLRRFKVNNIDWPWNKDKKQWKKLKSSLIWIYFRNYILLAPIVTGFYHYFSDTRIQLEDYPSLLVNKVHPHVAVHDDDDCGRLHLLLEPPVPALAVHLQARTQDPPPVQQHHCLCLYLLSLV